MTNNENSGSGIPEEQRGWQPIPQGGEYDAEATAFVQLPPEDERDAPLAAPGHGYVPPQIVPLTPAADPGAGSWGAVQHEPSQESGAVRWPEPQYDQPGHSGAYGQEQPYYDAYGAQAWHYGTEANSAGDTGAEGSAGAPGAGNEQHSELTGQWTIPVARGDLPEESGEYIATMPAAPWHGGTPPATLPGGAAAPWATQPEPAAPYEEPSYGESAPSYGEQPSPYGESAPSYGQPIAAAPASAPAPAEAPPAEGAPAEAGEAAAPEPYAEQEAAFAPEFQSAPDAEFEAGPPVEAVAEALPLSEQVGPEQPAPEQAVSERPFNDQPAADQPVSEALPEAAGVPEPEQDAAQDLAPDAPGLVAEQDLAAEQDPASEQDFAPDFAPEAEPAPDSEPVPEAAPAPAPLTSSSDSAEHPVNSFVLRVNGADRPVTDAWIGESLLYVLRERLGLAGAKDGCSQGECGACNVQVDGRLVASCLVPAATAAGSEVRTVEGLASDGEPSDVQRALATCGAVQCGFCIPGMAMTVHDLLEGNHAPSELETRQALCGNLCRCSGYRGVVDAVNEVAAQRAASAEAAAAASEEARIPHQAPPGAGGAQPSHPHSQHSHDGGMA
ncbi:2Fe-2S iron-sulfur cluster-binding protein [Streptomyces sp. NPDC088725]|uniref:2Fe-2S iron-sulfur cluster-binding protein n=1 Tax=Streptomyces sp. NPDC088725 TaxID=3365873 RepID=UPI0038038625